MKYKVIKTLAAILLSGSILASIIISKNLPTYGLEVLCKFGRYIINALLCPIAIMIVISILTYGKIKSYYQQIGHY